MAKWLIVAGLGFGDEGKGTTIDWLCRTVTPNLVVRYNGGPQALHHVVTAGGKVHGFRSFGSGTFCQVPTLLSSGMAVSLERIIQEATALKDNFGIDNVYSRLYISEDAPLLLSAHAIVTTCLEMARPVHLRHGTTGVGIGAMRAYEAETGNDPIRVKDILYGPFKEKLLSFRNWANGKVSQANGNAVWRLEAAQGLSLAAWLDSVYEANKTAAVNLPIISSNVEQLLLSEDLIYFEGAQGLLLDQQHGFFPHVTWSDTTFDAVMRLAMNVGVPTPDECYKLGVLRSYHTRHGAGPLVSQQLLPKPSPERQEKHNAYNSHMGHFRIGEFEFPLYNYARSVGSPDGIMMTHLDLAEEVQVVNAYEKDGALRYSIEKNPNADNTSFMENITAYLHKASPVGSSKTVMDTLEEYGYNNLGLVAGSYGPSAIEKQFIGDNLLEFLGI